MVSEHYMDTHKMGLQPGFYRKESQVPILFPDWFAD